MATILAMGDELIITVLILRGVLLIIKPFLFASGASPMVA